MYLNTDRERSNLTVGVQHTDLVDADAHRNRRPTRAAIAGLEAARRRAHPTPFIIDKADTELAHSRIIN